jgi:DNA ligase (NAD+)
VATLDPEVVELEMVIAALDTLYEEGEDCIHPVTGKLISDPEYDKLRKRLEKLHPQSKIFKTPTASKLVSKVKKVTHNPPMTSISKAIGLLSEREAALKKFQEEIKKELGYEEPPEKWLVQAYKRDGVAIANYYVKGILVASGLRPRNGFDGEDVTENVKYVDGVPTELWEHDKDGNRVRFLPVTCCIRGELECKKAVFRKIVEDWQNPKLGLNSEPKNPRNYTAGSIRQFTDPKVTKERRISFTGYSIVGWHSDDPNFMSPPFKTEIERAKYSNAVLRVPFVQVRPFRYQDMQMLEDLANSIDYEVDGVVVSVNNLEDAEQMGNTGGSATGNPKAKIAWKFVEQSAITEVKDIEWQPGRTGALTPVLKLDPVQLDGTTVSQCTGHSIGFLNGTSKASLGKIGIGSKVRIIKSGKIIPKVIEIIGEWDGPHVPSKCPSCGLKLVVEYGHDGSDLVCNNEFCGVRAVARFAHYLSTFGVKGVAESALSTMYSENVIKDIADIYDVTVSKLEKVGFSKRQSLLAVARIWMCPNPTSMQNDQLEELIADTYVKKIKIPAWQLLASLGIPGSGESAGQALIAHFGSFAAVRKAKLEELQAVENVGELTAKNIFNFFKKHKDMLDALLGNVDPEGPKVGKLTGKTFVFTGGFPGGKEKWEKEVMERGGKVSGSVSKTTNYTVVGENAGSKEEKAKTLGVPCISLVDLEKMLK